MKYFTRLFTTWGAMLVLLVPFVFANVAFAQTPDGGGTPAPADAGGGGGGGAPAAQSEAQKAVCEGVGLAGGDCNNAANGQGVSKLIKQGINLLSMIIGVAAVVMIMIGGFKYITSNGDSNSISSAKNTILYAVIGLVIVAVAQLIVVFVLKNVNGATTPPAPAP